MRIAIPVFVILLAPILAGLVAAVSLRARPGREQFGAGAFLNRFTVTQSRPINRASQPASRAAAARRKAIRSGR